MEIYESEEKEMEDLNISNVEVANSMEEECEAVNFLSSSSSEGTSTKRRTEKSTEAVAKVYYEISLPSLKSAMSEDGEDEIFAQMVAKTLKRKKNRKQKKEMKKIFFLCLMEDSDDE
ncbi:hypothetical protein ABEB36_007953 [Hypothenemus hampei]|uniref:Uncharacterized protein n=1 Tax=Hypothenemus hampei TaxID=57062 RepID=A0ABD1EVP3_HYPHA